MQFTGINFDHNAYDFAEGALLRDLGRLKYNQHTIHNGMTNLQPASKARFQRMPLGYGPHPGPRQDMLGRPRKFSATFQTAHITFRTPKSYLNTLMPTADFSIDARGGWTLATFSVTRLGNLEWLGGRGYTHFGLYVHDVVTKIGEEPAKGDLISVLFESLADPIITGREELGFPKVYATLDTRMSNSSYEMKAGWQGQSFCTLSLPALDRVATEDFHKAPELTYKVMPSSSGGLDVAYGQRGEDPLVRSESDSQWKAKNASITFTDLQGQELEKSFPTLAHIIARLRGIRIGEIVSSGVRMSEDVTGL